MNLSRKACISAFMIIKDQPANISLCFIIPDSQPLTIIHTRATGIYLVSYKLYILIIRYLKTTHTMQASFGNDSAFYTMNMKTYSREFIKKLGDGNKAAQKLLFGQLYAPMFRICQRYVPQTDEAEDCVMKGFLKAFQQLHTLHFIDDESLFKWMRRIMVNESLMEVRKKHSFYIMPDETLPEIAIPAEAWNKMDAEDLNRLILKLPTGYRTVFSLHVIEGYEHKEIAEMLGITESTSKTQLIKAKAKLRQMITQMKMTYGNVGR
jgi:RNA polymerase sigma factor (sigma-70 family)